MLPPSGSAFSSPARAQPSRGKYRAPTPLRHFPGYQPRHSLPEHCPCKPRPSTTQTPPPGTGAGPPILRSLVPAQGAGLYLKATPLVPRENRPWVPAQSQEQFVDHSHGGSRVPISVAPTSNVPPRDRRGECRLLDKGTGPWDRRFVLNPKCQNICCGKSGGEILRDRRKHVPEVCRAWLGPLARSCRGSAGGISECPCACALSARVARSDFRFQSWTGRLESRGWGPTLRG